MDSGSEYEYENESVEELEYTYEEESDTEYNDPAAAENLNISVGTISSSQANLSFKRKSLSPFGKNSLIRENGLSYELVVPQDSYVIRNSSEITPLLDALVNEVSVLLEVTEDEAQSLLQYIKWDKERLIDEYFSDPDQIRRKAGLEYFTSELLTTLIPPNMQIPPNHKIRTFKCRICCDEECDIRTGFQVGCGHYFCRDCYKSYLQNTIGDGASCTLVHCPEHQCKETVTKSIVHFFVDSNEAQRFDHFFLRNFIEKSKNMKYCPAPRCERVAIGSGITTIHCDCGYPFCFRCGEEAHDPCSCQQLAEWQAKCMNESETANWILANTKKCPNCNTRIEKNQGCNHMNCRVCKFEFCWICMGGWAEHGQTTGGYYKCNRYDADTSNPEASAIQKAKAGLDRYLHYYQRYHGHDSALKFANTLREQVERKMVAQQENVGKLSSSVDSSATSGGTANGIGNTITNTGWIDVQFLKQAAEQVIDCRRVLKYTYVLGYFLIDSTPEKQLFEYHQEMLEKHTEVLHEFTEKPFDQIDRSTVVNETRVVQNFMTSLLSSLSGGLVRLDDTTSFPVSFVTSNTNNKASTPAENNNNARTGGTNNGVTKTTQ